MDLKSRVISLTGILALTFNVGACSRSASPETDITPDIVRFMSTARIEPNPALTTSELRVAYGSSEFSVRDFNYMWYRNDKVVKGEHRNYLDPFHYLKDDELRCVISSAHPQAKVSRFETETVKIVNSPPQIIRACCVYKPEGKQRLEVQTDAVDYDDDRIRLVYLWFNNGQPLMDETGKSIDPSKFKRGDVIHAEVTATDHLGNSAPYHSTSWTVGNTPPRVVSTPIGLKAEDDHLLYRLQIQDRDGDPVIYRLIEGPEGMTVNTRGELRWDLPPRSERGKQYFVKVEADDGQGGQVVQSFRISI